MKKRQNLINIDKIRQNMTNICFTIIVKEGDFSD